VIFFKNFFADSKKNSRRRNSSPRASLFGEEFFTESPWEGSRQSFLLSAKNLFPVVTCGDFVNVMA
jgi:hypothetical protein